MRTFFLSGEPKKPMQTNAIEQQQKKQQQHRNPYAELLQKTLEEPQNDSTIEVTAVNVETSKQANDEKSHKIKERRRKRTHGKPKDLILSTESSSSDIKELTRDVKLRFKARKSGSESSLKTLLQLDFEHVEVLYDKGFYVDCQSINEEATTSCGKKFSSLDSSVVSFSRIMRTRLSRIYTMLNVLPSGEFCVSAKTRCVKCPSQKEAAIHGGYEQCDRCAETDCLKMMTFVEFYALAMRHQNAGTLQVLNDRARSYDKEKRERRSGDSVVFVSCSESESFSSRRSEESNSYESEEDDEEKKKRDGEEDEEEDTVITLETIDTNAMRSISADGNDDRKLLSRKTKPKDRASHEEESSCPVQ